MTTSTRHPFSDHTEHLISIGAAENTKRLIREKGFTGVAVEADWPDAYRVNRFVRGVSEDADAEQALAGFRWFTQGMWRRRGEIPETYTSAV